MSKKITKGLKVLEDQFNDLYFWLIQLSRFNKAKDFIIADYKDEKQTISVRIYTKEYQYTISAKLPKDNDKGYLGCIAESRKPLAGEKWARGNDLPDGDYSEETFNEIVAGIVRYEIVRVVQPDPDKLETVILTN